MICIWCLRDFATLSLEHGIPESLGCPRTLTLNDVACAGCNNALGVVDQALLKQFEMMTVMYGVPRKNGRPPTIDSWASISSEHREDGPHIYINGGPGVIEARGKLLRPPSKARGITDVWIEPETGSLGYSQEFGNDRRFLPALYKIGLNLVARYYGPTVAAGPSYDHVRAFVREYVEAPDLRAAMEREAVTKPITGASGPITKSGRPYPMFRITILGVSFMIDLAPDQPGLRDFRSAAVLHGEPLYVFPSRRAA